MASYVITTRSFGVASRADKTGIIRSMVRRIVGAGVGLDIAAQRKGWLYVPNLSQPVSKSSTRPCGFGKLRTGNRAISNKPMHADVVFHGASHHAGDGHRTNPGGSSHERDRETRRWEGVGGRHRCHGGHGNESGGCILACSPPEGVLRVTCTQWPRSSQTQPRVASFGLPSCMRRWPRWSWWTRRPKSRRVCSRQTVLTPRNGRRSLARYQKLALDVPYT